MGDAVVANEYLVTGLLVGMTVEVAAGGSGGGKWDGGGEKEADQDEAEAVECEESHRCHRERFEVMRK